MIGFARVFGNGAVLQRNREIHIWGFASAGAEVTVELAGSSAKAAADERGRFDVTFPAMDKGGPYVMSAACGSEIVSVSDIMVGDVIVISGQSNMEFPMSRVRETYPHEWDRPGDNNIRTFKITEKGLFGKDIPDVETGEWKCFSGDTIDDYSAVGYFTAKHIRAEEDVTVGLIDITLGGAPIEAFLSEGSLEGFDDALAEARKFSDDDYTGKVLADNEKNAAAWLAELDKNDRGCGRYEDGEEILAKGRSIMFPSFFSDTELDGFVGSVWIAKRFTVDDKYAGKAATLYFGTLVDLDFCYVNGKFIGQTEYTYPPRRYAIPEGLLKKGENTVVLRIGVEKGYGRVTPGKLYGVVFGDGVRITDGFNERIEGCDHIEYLGGEWKYLEGYRCAPSAEQVFVNWKPTALYHGMMAPLSGLTAKAFAFYQGESNCPRNHEYACLTERLAEQVRAMWGEGLPYICVQLPEFNARMEEISYDGGKAWRGLMAAQEKCTDIPGFYLVRTNGTGELNDLHPQRKEPIGENIARIVTSLDR